MCKFYNNINEIYLTRTFLREKNLKKHPTSSFGFPQGTMANSDNHVTLMIQFRATSANFANSGNKVYILYTCDRREMWISVKFSYVGIYAARED